MDWGHGRDCRRPVEVDGRHGRNGHAVGQVAGPKSGQCGAHGGRLRLGQRQQLQHVRQVRRRQRRGCHL